MLNKFGVGSSEFGEKPLKTSTSRKKREIWMKEI